MSNETVLKRLAGIHAQLMGGFESSGGMSAASKGRERELFVNSFLKNVFPTPYRFGTGDIVDSQGNQSGQVDVVVENPFGPSLASLGGGEVRLFFAETVALVLEVKSNVATQWKEVEHVASKIRPLRKNLNNMVSWGEPIDDIPLFVIGFKGWSDIRTLESHVNEESGMSGILVIEEQLFYFRKGKTAAFSEGGGPHYLLFFLAILNKFLTKTQAANFDISNYFSEYRTAGLRERG